MTIHTLKIEKRWYDRIKMSEKTSELRFNDRDFQVGDLVQFDVTSSSLFPDKMILEEFEITHVLPSGVCKGLLEGYCILSLKKLIVDNVVHPLKN